MKLTKWRHLFNFHFIKKYFQVFVNEVDNDPASQAVEIVLNYIKKNPSLGLSVQIIPVEGNRTDSKKFLENSKFILMEITECFHLRIIQLLQLEKKNSNFFTIFFKFIKILFSSEFLPIIFSNRNCSLQ